jgi:uncharacterized RDD family membrane protein YckC
MLCPRCGAECGDSIRLCDQCSAAENEQKKSQAVPATAEISTTETDPELASLGYAGFWLRVCSSLIDTAIINAVLYVLTQLLFLGFRFSVVNFLARSLTPAKVDMQNLVFQVFWGLFTLAIVLVFLTIVGSLVYYVIFECSPWQATPGKKFVGTAVGDIEGQRLSCTRSLLRNLLKTLSVLILGLGFLFPLFTKKKQTLHDVLAGCTVRKREEKPLFNLFAAAIAALVVLFFVHPGETKSYQHRPSTTIHLQGSNSPTFGIKPLPGISVTASVPSATPTPAATIEPPPQPTPEEPAEHFNGPHARMRAANSMFDAKAIVAFYYPKNNSVAIGFYPSPISPAELELMKKRGVLAKAGEGNRPLMSMYLDFKSDSAPLSKNSLTSYTLNFYQDAGKGFIFPSVNDAVSLGKSQAQLTAEDEWHIEGTLTPGGRLKIVSRGKGKPKTNPKLNVRWDIEEEITLLSSN